MKKFKTPPVIDIEKTTGIKDTRTQAEIEDDALKLEYMMSLHLIGIFDDGPQDYQKNSDRRNALKYIENNEEIPEDLLQRILKYKAEDEEEFKKIDQKD